MTDASETGAERVPNEPLGVRALSSWELGLSLVGGFATFVLSTIFLGPWPDLLGEEARQMGQLRWYLEFFKSVVPLGLALVVTLGIILFLQRRSLTVERETGH
jgi:hypothetical protein